MPNVESERAVIYYETYGDGPALVFAHGGGGNTLSWWQQVPFFSNKFRVILFDHRGFGRSTCETDAFHPKYFPGDLMAILQKENIPKATLICQSMGGLTGLPFTLKYPGQVRALILCGTTGGLWIPRERRADMPTRDQMEKRPPGSMVMARDFPKREPELTFLFSMITRLNGIALMERLRTGMAESRVLVESLEGYKTPTLLIHGSEDALFPPDSIKAVEEMIPGAKSIEIPGAGHSTYFETPEKFNEIINEFVNSLHGDKN